MYMKCKDCQYCSQRGGYQYFFCDRDNSLINSNDYYRGNPLIDMIGASLGYSKEQLDYLFEHKTFKKVEGGLLND